MEDKSIGPGKKVTNSDSIYIDAFKAYKDMGLDPLPIPYENGHPTKAPKFAGWQTKAENREFTDADFADPCNIGNLLGGRRNLTDIDLDSLEAIRIGNDIFNEMKIETIVFGHPKKLRSHFILATDKSLPTERIIDPITKECLIEYRCVKTNGGRGIQTVFPPSLRYDATTGESDVILPDEDSAAEPMEIDSATLHQAFLQIAAISLLAKHFPTDNHRHETFLALAGLFARSGMPEEDARRAVTLAYRYSAGYNNDEDNAASAVASVYRTFNDIPSAHLFGYPKLIEAIDKVVVDRALEILGMKKPQQETTDERKVNRQRRRSPEEIDGMLTSQHLSKLPIPEVSYLIEPEIPRGALICVTGKPGAGKTTIITTWCKEIAEEKNLPIIYLNRDNPQGVMSDRMAKLGGIPDNFLIWGNWNNDEGDPFGPPDLDSLELDDYIRSKGDCVVVIDTLRSFANGDENDNSAMGESIKPLRRWTGYGATVIIIHHQDKEGKHAYRGASSLEGALDVGLLIEAPIIEGKIDRMTVKAFKSRMGDNVNVVYAMKDGVPVRQTETIPDKLVKLLRQNPAISKDKFEKLAMAGNFKRNTVREFIEKGLANKTIIWRHGSITATDRSLMEEAEPDDSSVVAEPAM